MPTKNPILEEAQRLAEESRLLSEQANALLAEIDQKGHMPALEQRAVELRSRLKEVGLRRDRLVVIEDAVGCAFRLRTGRDPISGVDVITDEDDALGAQIAQAILTPQSGAAN